MPCLLVDLCKLLLRLRCLIHIRMVLLGQLEIRFLDIVLVRPLGHLEDPVEVFLLVTAATEEGHFRCLIKGCGPL
jgi:hypothetical protein